MRQALADLVTHLGDMPHNWPSVALGHAYSRAHELLYPEEYEFRDRFMAQQNSNAEPSATTRSAGG